MAFGKQAARNWWTRTKAQFRAQHKLLRVLMHRLNVNQDPRKVHTLMQKAAVLAVMGPSPTRVTRSPTSVRAVCTRSKSRSPSGSRRAALG